jgi:hypothetical protein
VTAASSTRSQHSDRVLSVLGMKPGSPATPLHAGHERSSRPEACSRSMACRSPSSGVAPNR